jgi:YidC/Oxa1 family membrane protein insertase
VSFSPIFIVSYFSSPPSVSPAPEKSKVSTLELVLTFALLFFVTQAGLKYFFPAQFGGKVPEKEVLLQMEARSVRLGNDPVVIIKNDTDQDLALPKRCPQPPVNIGKIDKKEDGTETHSDLMPNESVLPCTDLALVKAHSNVHVNLAGWKYALFENAGTYEASLDLPEPFVKEGKPAVATVTFSMVEPGVFTKLFRTFVARPLFNALIFIGTWIPGHNLGLSIIVLTILIKLLLLIPSQHALEGQKKLQEVQPKMDEIKKKYPNDPTRVQEETMKLWKELKINPLQSCLPTLLQLPILIGLFLVIRDGIHLSTSQHLVYPFYQSLPSDFFGNTFLWFDLLKPDFWFFPIFLVVLQFIQMHMMMKKNKKKDEIVVTPVGKKWKMPELDQQTIMMYVLPLMIGYFAIKFPVAVSLYWAVSTLFGIAQQWFVLKKKNS